MRPFHTSSRAGIRLLLSCIRRHSIRLESEPNANQQSYDVRKRAASKYVHTYTCTHTAYSIADGFCRGAVLSQTVEQWSEGKREEGEVRRARGLNSEKARGFVFALKAGLSRRSTLYTLHFLHSSFMHYMNCMIDIVPSYIIYTV